MIIVSGKVVVKDAAAIEELRPVLQAQITSSRAEEGCIDYSYGIDLTEPNVIHILEYWKSWEALETHFKMPYMATLSKALQSAGILSRNITAVEATNIKEL